MLTPVEEQDAIVSAEQLSSLALDEALAASFAELAVIDNFEIVDDTTRLDADKRLKRVKDCAKAIEAAAAPRKSLLNRLKDSLMASIKTFTDPLAQKETALKAKIFAYDTEVARKKAEAIAEAERIRKEQDAEYQKTLAEMLPWEEAPVRPLAPVIPMVASVKTTSGLRNLPATAEVEDLDKFFEAAYTNKALREYWMPNQKMLDAKAKQRPEAGLEIFPGVFVRRKQTVAAR